MENELNVSMSKKMLEFWNSTPLFSWAGLSIIDAKNGEAHIELVVQDHHRGGGGTSAINGGIVAYMFDGLLGTAIISKWGKDIVGQVTITLNIEYLHMIQAQKKVVGKAKVVRITKTMAFAEGQVFDENGDLCAKCNGIFRLFRAK